MKSNINKNNTNNLFYSILLIKRINKEKSKSTPNIILIKSVVDTFKIMKVQTKTGVVNRVIIKINTIKINILKEVS